MNNCTERVYNGLVKENPTFRIDVRYVSNPCGNKLRNKRCRHGAFHYGCTCTVKYVDFHAP